MVRTRCANTTRLLAIGMTILPMARRRVIILNDEVLFVRVVKTHWTRKHRIHLRHCDLDEGDENALASRFNRTFRAWVMERNRGSVRSCRANGPPPSPRRSIEAITSSSTSNCRSEPTTQPTHLGDEAEKMCSQETTHRRHIRNVTYRLCAANPRLYDGAACIAVYTAPRAVAR